MVDHRVRLFLTVTLLVGSYWEHAAALTSSAHLPVEARDESGSQEEDIIATSYVLPNQIFNDGKPYYAAKDPVSGQPDFNAKKPAGIETAANEVVDPKEKIVLSSSAPNIHDFLNLPVKYSSSKFVYPLVSSSYANLKYQGSNKNYVTNKKPTSVMASVTPVPVASSHNNYYTVPTTKLMAVPPTAPGVSSASSPSSTSTTTTTTTTFTSKKPASTSATTTSTTTTSTSTAPKHSTSTRKPIPTSTLPPRLSVSTTRKKFIPTKKYSGTSPTGITTSAIPVRFPNETRLNTTPPPKKPIATTATISLTTRPPRPHATHAPHPSTSSTQQPVVFTENPNAGQPAFSPLPEGSTRVPQLDAADVYQTIELKNTEQKIEQKPSMSLADIFNSLAEEESAVSTNNAAHQGFFDAQGNLLQPIEPSQPSPFAMQHPPRPPTTHATSSSTAGTMGTSASGGVSPNQNTSPANQESFSNEYVSYQVQQPNMMAYRPTTVNNVVISPGQHSASFVLGSQQQVGTGAFGSVQKEPLFDQKSPVQYGTVINEDISALQRPGYQQVPAGGNSNFHQNGNFPHAPSGPSGQMAQKRPSLTTSNVYQEGPPAPPSPFQQLPLIGVNKIPKPHISMQHDLLPQPPQIGQTNTYPPQPSALPQTGVPPATPESNQQVINGSPLSSSQDTKELLVSTNIRFPASDDQSEEYVSGPVAAGPPAGPQVNGHAQPLSLQQIQNSNPNPVVFPKNQDEEANFNDVQFQTDDVQIQKQQVLTMNQHKQKLNFPQLPDHITPSQHMEPPPRFQGEPAELQKRPQLNRPHGPLQPQSQPQPPHQYKAVPGNQRPNPDRHLPNILPQFRPNAKISGGHAPPASYNQESGNIRLPGQMKRPNAPPPQFAHRRQPLLQQKRYPMNRIAEYPAGPPPPLPPQLSPESNRRIYRLPPYGGQNVPYVERNYARRPLMRPAGDLYTAERHAAAAANIAETYQTLPADLTADRLAAFEEEDLVINDPPQPVTSNKDAKSIDEAKLEPVVTLQMLQSQKKAVTLPGHDTGAGEIQVPATGLDPAEESSNQNGLYVVYPMKASKTDKSEATDESSDALPAVAHVESPSGSDYQNTPFSVVRDQPQEPLLTVKNNKQPQSLQQQAKTQPLKDRFPYSIEKPDSSYSGEAQKPYVPGVLIAPRIINGVYGPGNTETAPIAIAYTPTESNPYRLTPPPTHKYSNVNLATPVIGEIRTDTQTEEGISTDFDLRGQNFEKNFMAPFYPSVSLGAATSAPASGWSILPPSQDDAVYAKNQINRADVVEEGTLDTDSGMATTKMFELENFQPELQGGFKPIYPPGYKIEDDLDDAIEDANDQPQEHVVDSNRPISLASHMDPTTTSTTAKPTSTYTTTSTTSTTKPKISAEKGAETSVINVKTSTTTTTTDAPAPNTSTSSTATPPTTAPTQRKKSVFETSLEALLFGEDEDFNEEARKAQSKAVISARLTAPRMGPRNLKLS